MADRPAPARTRARVLALAAVLAALSLLPLPRPAQAVTSTTYQNPVFATDFPDPFVLPTRGLFVAYATNRDRNVQVVSSRDLVRWTLHGDAMPVLPSWARSGHTWAPAVLELAGQYVLYFTARHHRWNVPCIGMAVSVGPKGPFMHTSSEPLVCQPGRGGSIDPSVYRHTDSSLWLLWKSEGHRRGEPTRIWSHRLRGDGQALTGRLHQLLRTDRPWEGPIIENPSMVRIDGRLHLFYSGNRWETDRYAIGYATCRTPAGPCTKAGGPLVRSTPAVAGPGGQEFVRMLDGSVWMAYHGWDPGRVGYPHGHRSLRIDRVRVVGGRPEVRPTAQPTRLG